MEKDIAKKLHQGIQEHRKYQENTGDMFNVFDAMKVRTSELAWSAVIAYLLDPNGRHYCGDVFLTLFLKQLSPIFDIDTKSAKVYTEYVDNGLDGRIDILVKDDIKKRAIIIENKIFASDRPEQISRYYHYANDKTDFQDFRVLYLTRFGSKPSNESTCGVEDFYCISYIDTVKGWLEECNRKCLDKKRVHDFICQAVEAINDLCRQTIIDDYIRQLIEESLNLNKMVIQERIERIQGFSQSEYIDVAEQCTKLIKQYRKEQFDELITRYFHHAANILPLEGVLDGYWCCRAIIDGYDEIDNVFVMHDWEGRSLYCGIEYKNISGQIYSALNKKANTYIDNKNKKRMIWQIQGLEDFAAMYEQLKKVLMIVTT